MKTATVELVYYGVPLTCEVEFHPGEPAIYFGDNAHPGAAPEAILIRALAGGVNVLPLLAQSGQVVIEGMAVEMLEAA